MLPGSCRLQVMFEILGYLTLLLGIMFCESENRFTGLINKIRKYQLGFLIDCAITSLVCQIYQLLIATFINIFFSLSIW